MFTKVLVVSLTQVLRSAVLLLLPISFITLIAWATAGSATGNTDDPLRAGLWIWLAAHHTPFSLTFPPAGVSGLLSYLPIGALIFPIFAIRSGFSRTLDNLNDRSLTALARVLFSFWYTLIAIAISYFSATESVTPIWYLTPVIVAPLALLISMSVGRRAPLTQPILYSSRIIALLLGFSSIILGVSLLLNLATVKYLTQVLEPGILGGFLLLFLNALYLPNFAVATLSYISGAGFAVGSETFIAPWSYRSSEIPAIPLLGALPTGTLPWALLGAVFIVAAGALLTSWTISLSSKILVQSFFIAAAMFLILAALSGGQLLTQSMGSVGVSIWQSGAAIIGELAIGVALAIYLPRISIGRSR